jgi:8-oxo-dGTP pyrophosphatase MutT (NUDIX family)
VEPGEGVRAAAVGELAEEIGLVVAPALLEGPVWFRRHVGPNAFVQVGSRETFFVLHEVDASGRTELELLGAEPHRWWSAVEVAASREAVAPRDLAVLLPELSRGPWTGPPRFVAWRCGTVESCCGRIAPSTASSSRSAATRIGQPGAPAVRTATT